MKNIKNKIENKLYSYQPGEFLPIFYDGKLQNKREFVAYKLRTILR